MTPPEDQLRAPRGQAPARGAGISLWLRQCAQNAVNAGQFIAPDTLETFSIIWASCYPYIQSALSTADYSDRDMAKSGK
jgi:hypothetical protein